MLGAIEKAVREAGRIALDLADTADVYTKGRGDFVTDADLAVSRFLTGRLPELFPDTRVMSEEEQTEQGLEGKLFIVDPIDGTTNLMYRMNLSAVSCGYAQDGVLLCGVVYNPFTGELFKAERGKGAFLNDRRIHVNGDETIGDSLIGIEAGPVTAVEQGDFLRRVMQLHRVNRGMRLTGSAALDLCYTACGRLSATVFHYLYPWDYAAGKVILEEAGGRFDCISGREPALAGRSEPLLASNGLLHEAIRTIMRD